MIDKLKNKVINKFKVVKDQDGMGTIEMIFLVAVLLSLAISFGYGMKKFVSARLDDLTNEDTFDKVDPSNIDSWINNENKQIVLEDGSYIELGSNII
ncbi:MAG: hypothetical protein WBA54_03130 [Acidaminobacteraceae bacterium]